ncbi:hypothetical protein QBC40DRAFT_183537, partial [Triangularia verruculosa]
PGSNLKAATCPSKKARIAGIPNDTKAPAQAFFCLAQNGVALFNCHQTVCTVCSIEVP